MPGSRHRALIAGAVLVLALGCWALGANESSGIAPAAETGAVDGAALQSYVGTVARPLRTSLPIVAHAPNRAISTHDPLVPTFALHRSGRPSLPLYALFRVYRL